MPELTKQMLLKMMPELEENIDNSYSEYLKQTGDTNITKAEYVRRMIEKMCTTKAMTKSFKDQHIEMQYMILELMELRKYNNETSTNKKRTFLFSEASILCSTFERFLRILPAIKAKDTETLSNFLERALSKKKPLFRLPFEEHNLSNERIIKLSKDIRNGISHSNFEQLMKEWQHKNVKTVEEYCRGGFFCQDIEILFKVFDCFIKQINPNTGEIVASLNK